MPLGPWVRSRLGRFERPVADVYRGWFVDLADLARTLASIAAPRSILEIGCGAGDLSARMLGAFPDATVLGTDLCADPGSRCSIAPGRVTFRQAPASDLLAEHAGGFDLVVLCDVLHHVAPAERPALVRTAAALTAPGGRLVLKDWEPTPRLANAAATVSDRYITGDRGVTFLSRAELRSLAEKADGFEITLEARVPPRRNNLLLALTAPS